MINLYRTKNKFKDDEILIDNDGFFNNINIDIICNDADCINKMSSIDNAIMIDKNVGIIKTPFGVTSIKDLSTGCKTVLNYICIAKYNMYNSIKAIDITECGANAIEELFETMEKLGKNISLILKHNYDLVNCKNREYCIDGRDIVTDLFTY